MKSGIKLIEDIEGIGPELEKNNTYLFKIGITLNKGDQVVFPDSWAPARDSKLEENGTVLIRPMYYNRESMINGMFYGIKGMRVWGKRVIKISPHLAYGEKGYSGVIPENSVLTMSIEVLGNNCV